MRTQPAKQPSRKRDPDVRSSVESIQPRARALSQAEPGGPGGSAAEWVKPSALKPWPQNPTKDDPASVRRVAESIKRFGFGAPLVARRTNGEVIAGHTRLRAAKQLGLELVPVRYLDINEKDAHVLALADNRLAALTLRNNAELAELLKAMEPSDQLLAGYTGGDVQALRREVEGDADVVEDEVPPLPKDPITKPGDVWVLGRHRLICGDCTSRACVLPLFGERRAAYTFTSPPYGIDLNYEQGDSLPTLTALISGAIDIVAEISRPDAYATMNYADVYRPGEHGFTLMSQHYDAPFRRHGWLLRGNRIWHKPFARLALSYGTSTTMNLREWEYVQTWRRGTGAEKLREHGKTLRGVWASFGEQAIIPVSAATDDTTSKSVHQAAFPVLLPTAGVRCYTDRGDLVWEPFCGSGTTLIACEREQRDCFAAELSPAYCDVIVERWQNLTGGKAERESS